MEFVNHNKDVGERNDNFKESSYKTQFMLYNVDKEHILRGLELYLLGYRNNDCTTVYDEEDSTKCIGLAPTCRYVSLLKDPQFRCSDPRLFLIPLWSTEALWKELPETVIYDGKEYHKNVFYHSLQGWSVKYRGLRGDGLDCIGPDRYIDLISVTSAETCSKELKDNLYEALIRLSKYMYKK